MPQLGGIAGCSIALRLSSEQGSVQRLSAWFAQIIVAFSERLWLWIKNEEDKFYAEALAGRRKVQNDLLGQPEG